MLGRALTPTEVGMTKDMFAAVVLAWTSASEHHVAHHDFDVRSEETAHALGAESDGDVPLATMFYIDSEDAEDFCVFLKVQGNHLLVFCTNDVAPSKVLETLTLNQNGLDNPANCGYVLVRLDVATSTTDDVVAALTQAFKAANDLD